MLGGMVLALGSSASANLHTVTFSNPPGVPTGHLPDTGGVLTPTSHNFVEDGIHAEAFWVPNVANTHVWPAGFRPDAHFHHLENGYETSHAFQTTTPSPNWDTQGIYLEMEDGSSFDLISLDYRLVRIPAGTSILISADYDPMQPTLAQFTAFSVTQQSTFSTLNIDGFDNVDHLFISSVLGVSQLQNIRWDNIVVDRHNNTSVVPLPAPAILGAAGLLLVPFARRARARS